MKTNNVNPDDAVCYVDTFSDKAIHSFQGNAVLSKFVFCVNMVSYL